MSTWYVDYVGGNDGNAGTSWVTAKKNISAVVPVAGDEIRVAKSADPVALSGLFIWTDGSAVVATAVNQIGTVVAGDFIAGANNGLGGIWEVSSVSATDITLTTDFTEDPSTLASSAGYLIPTIDVGSPGAAGDTIHSAPAVNGTDVSPIEIIGGWNTGSDTQDGYSHFSVTFGASRYGRFVVGSDYYTISRIGMHRSYDAFILIPSDGTQLDECFGTGYAINGVDTGGSNKVRIANSWFIANTTAGSTGVRVQNSDGTELEFAFLFRNQYGLDIEPSSNFTQAVVGADRNVTGIKLQGSHNRIIGGSVLSNSVGIQVTGRNNRLGGMAVNLNALDITVGGVELFMDNVGYGMLSTVPQSVVRSDRDNIDPDLFLRISDFGEIRSDTVDSITGKCLKMEPNATAGGGSWLEQRWRIPVEASGSRQASLYIKEDGSWNGSRVEFGLQSAGAWISGDPSSIVPALSYNQYMTSVYGPAAAFDETVELVVRTDGTAGAIFVDDVTWT